MTVFWRENPLAVFGFPKAYRLEVSDSPDFEHPTVVADVAESSSVVMKGEGRNAGTGAGSYAITVE